ncbi:MAG TPA: S-adenosylmethionine:tRNA ribosyltransferase-isomerase [Chitinophagaceae bacterium]
MESQYKNILIDEYNYELPQEKIAEHPLVSRDASHLLVWDGSIKDEIFSHLPDFLPLSATLVLNNTKVIEARVFFQKETGAIIEIFCLEPWDPRDVAASMAVTTGRVQWLCLIGGASKWKKGQALHKKVLIDGEEVTLSAHYISKEVDSFIIEFDWTSHHAFAEVLHHAGAIPLPPYIKRKAEEEDATRYQTIFAEHEGSVAAPTAALHFTKSVFDSLAQKNIHPHYVTLHVGAGTFKPVKAESIGEHAMHAESFLVEADTLRALLNAETIIAVGTTSLRTLESLHWLGVKLKEGHTDFTLEQWEAYDLEAKGVTYKASLQALLNHLEAKGEHTLHCRTSLIIVPGYHFKSAKALVTNFHQPRSTLLLLVAAFIGEEWKKVYDHALTHNYRFLSYGDSSLLWRKNVSSAQ